MKLLIALFILCFAVGVVAYIAYAWWILDRDEPDSPDLLPLDEMDEEAAVSVCNDRRSRVLSETGHLPPRLPGTDYAPASMRAAEDCQ